jgi:regulator of replication initiation timing
MTRRDEIIELLNRGALPNTLAVSYLWETFSDQETGDLLESARKLGSQKLAQDLLTFLYAIAKEKDDWYVVQVLELIIQHPLVSNSAKLDALKTMRKHLDKVRATLAGAPKQKHLSDQLRRAETNFHAMHKRLRSEDVRVVKPEPQRPVENDQKSLVVQRDRLQAEIEQLKNQLASLKREQERMAEEVARLDLDLQRKKARVSQKEAVQTQTKKEKTPRQPQSKVKGLDANLDLPDFLK